MRRGLVTLLSAGVLVLLFSIFFSRSVGTLNVRTTQKRALGCSYESLSGRLDYSQKTAIFEGEEVKLPWFAFENSEPQVLGLAEGERWIEVDLSEQKLYAWEGDRLFLETSVSTGLPWWPTPTGEFRIWIKLRATKMEGGQGEYYYYLPNVPYVMYFENDKVPGWRGYGLHGTYWHNDFGTQRSHGCVNLPTPVAKELYFWISPDLSESKYVAKSDSSNPGTRVVIHE